MTTCTCTCPKRTENGFLTRVGRDIACPAHGDPAPHAAHQPLVEVQTGVATLSAGLNAIEKAQAEIIQTPERAREALRERADLPGERYD